MNMEEQKESLFDLQMDPVSMQHLQDAAKWGKFLAIIGFVMIGLLVILGIVMGTLLSAFNAAANLGGIRGPLISVVYIAFAVLYFFPCLYLFRFSGKMQAAIRTNDQESLIDAFSNLKSCLRFVGILMIIAIGFYLLFILVFVIGTATSGF